jgi:DNA invertase Pin-like site-specific DNA recombinase
MVGQTVGYVRVSSSDQNPARQLEQLGDCDEIFTDTESGRSRTNRHGLKALIKHVRQGDTVRVHSMDRLGRDTLDLYQILHELMDEGATVVLVSEGITVSKDNPNPMQKMMLGFLAAIADFERAKIRERQAEGIAIAKAKGKYVQQPKLDADDIEQIKVLLELGHDKTAIARQFSVSRQTVYNALRRSHSNG